MRTIYTKYGFTSRPKTQDEIKQLGYIMALDTVANTKSDCGSSCCRRKKRKKGVKVVVA
jgi:hypothetical protein